MNSSASVDNYRITKLNNPASQIKIPYPTSFSSESSEVRVRQPPAKSIFFIRFEVTSLRSRHNKPKTVSRPWQWRFVQKTPRLCEADFQTVFLKRVFSYKSLEDTENSNAQSFPVILYMLCLNSTYRLQPT